MKNKSTDNQYAELTKLHYRYQSAFAKKAINLLDEISESVIIKSYFEFLGDFYERNKSEKNYYLLPLPAFQSEGKSFQDVVKSLAGTLFSESLLKEFESKTRTYGVTFLNNFYFLCQVYEIEKLDMNEVYDLDHSKAISRNVIDQLDPITFDFLFRGLNINQVFELIVSAHEMMVFQIFKIIDQNTEIEDLRKLIPKDAQTFEEIHDSFQRYIAKLRSGNRPLKQSIGYLHGKKILDFQIEVPSFSHDLYDICKALDETFSNDINFRANKVIKGDCQVLNLVKDGKRIYTVELIPTPEGFRINHLKDISNTRTTHQELLRLTHFELSRIINN